MKRLLYVIILMAAVSAGAQGWNCTSWSSSGQCSLSGSSGSFRENAPGQSTVGGGVLTMIPTGLSHVGKGIIYQTRQNVQAFHGGYQFVMNGWTLALSIQNVNNVPGFQQNQFVAGAGCEDGSYQGFPVSGVPLPPDNEFYFVLSSYDSTTGGAGFTHSNAQIYQQMQSPCIPNDSQPVYYNTNKISTLPIDLTGGGGMNAFTGHTYQVLYGYDGTTFSTCLYDVTAANGSCSSSTSGTGTFFQQSWGAINIPSLVYDSTTAPGSNNTAWVGLTAGTGNANTTTPLLINSFSYVVDTPPTHPSISTYTSQSNSGGTPVNAPTFSPAAGTYGSTQNVTIASSSGSSYSCYILSSTFPALLPQVDNRGGCMVGTLYSSPVSVSSTQTLYAMSGNTARLAMPSNLTVGLFTIGGGTPTAATPVFSPVPGTYTSTQTVTASNGSSAPTGCYTTNGATPATNGTTGCTSGTLYSSSITVATTETLKMVWGGTGFLDSSVASGTYTINPPAATPTFSPAAGTYTSVQTVTISTTTGSPTIHYTTDGSTPTLTSTTYTGPITVGTSQTVKAVAIASGFSISAVGSAAYVINLPVVATPVFSPVPATYTSAQTVSVTDSTAGASIFCTTNGTTPTPSSPPYTGPFSVPATQTIQCIATAAGFANSLVGGGLYTINLPPPAAATPTFSPGAGTYGSAQTVALSSTTPASTIHYSFNNVTFFTYTSPLLISTSETVYAYATASGFTQSATGSAVYVISLTPAATPTFTPAAGTYTTIQSVTLASATGGATITYTTDGTTPTPASTPYTGAISVGVTQTIKALATAPGFSNSAVGSALYTINLPTAATPTFSPVAGTYTSAQTVAISSTTGGAALYFTTNGATPTTSSTLYTGPITVSISQTVKAIAVLTGFNNSAVGSAAYTITSPPPGCTITGTMVFHGTVTLVCPQ